MKKQDLYEILDEIYTEDPSLKQDEKKLVEVLTLFSKLTPTVPISSQFKKELKQAIISEVLKKKEKRQFFSYIKIGSFILSWALWAYLSFFIFAPFFNQNTVVVPPTPIQSEESTGETNKMIEVMPEVDKSISPDETLTEDKPESIIKEETVEEKPKISPEKTRTVEPQTKKIKPFQTTITEKGEIAFWNINEEINRSEVTARMSLMMSEEATGWAAMDSSAFSKMAPSDDATMFAEEAPPEENIPEVEKKYTFKWNLAIKIPEKMNVYKNTYKIDIPLVEEKIDEYTFMYDFNRNALSLYKEYIYENNENIRYNFRDSEIKESLSTFINKYGIDVSGYGEPEVFFNGLYSDFIPGNEREGSEKILTIRFPLLIDGKSVYTDFWDKVGAYMSYDVSKKSIISFSDITYTNKEKSLYSVDQDIESILKTDEITAWVVYSDESLKNPSLVYLFKNDYYIPALKFTTENNENKIFELVK